MENNKINNDLQTIKQKQAIKKQGALNPMFGKHHDEITRRKISDSQKKRYETIRQAIKNESVGRADKKAREDLLNQAIYKDTIGFRDSEQLKNFVEIMTQNDMNWLKNIVKDAIEEWIIERDRHA